VGVLAGGLAGCGKQPAEKTSAAPRVSARFAEAQRVAARQRIEIAGNVEAERSAAVSSRVMAMVTAVHVQVGDVVRSGQILISIDPTAAQGQVAQARGGLAQAAAGLALAQRNHERFQALATTQSASALEVDMARAQYEQARGAVEQAQGAVAAATSVARESAVVAPFAGRVAARLVEVGDLAAPGRPLATIESLAGRRVVLSVPEGLVHGAGLIAGAQVPVRIDARADLGELTARVVEVTPGPDPVTHSYTAKLSIEAVASPPGFDGAPSLVQVPSGSAARAFLSASTREAVLVPREAVIDRGGLWLVVVRDGEGRAQTRAVTLGDGWADGRVEILSGLQGGERVAVGLVAAPPAGAWLDEATP
jgi:RND family efflux transporter MFP subunit